MSYQLPSNVKQFVQDQLDLGNYQNEEDVVVDALNALCLLRSRHAELYNNIQSSLAEAKSGQVAPLDTGATKREGRRILTEQGSRG